jgi:hypothetical protein
VRLEPFEEVTCEVGEEQAGAIIEALALRRGELMDMVPLPGGWAGADSSGGRWRLVQVLLGRAWGAGPGLLEPRPPVPPPRRGGAGPVVYHSVVVHRINAAAAAARPQAAVSASPSSARRAACWASRPPSPRSPGARGS